MVTAAFQATRYDDPNKDQWWIEIEGIRRRYGSHIPSWASAIPDTGMNRPIRDWFEKKPRFRGQEARPLDGSTKPHEFIVRIVDIDDEFTDLVSVHDDTCARTILHAAVGSGDAFIDVVDASGFSANSHIYVNRETMYCTAINIGGGAGGSDRMTVGANRGLYGSEDADHPLTDSQGNTLTVLVADKPRFMHTREIALLECREGLVEADAIKFRGFIDTIEEDDGAWVLNCSGFLKRIACRIGETLAETTLQYPLWGGLDPSNSDSLLPRVGVTTWAMEVADVSKFESEGHVIVDNEIVQYISKCASSGHAAEFGPLLKMSGYIPEANIRDIVPPWTGGRGKFSQDIFGEKGVVRKEVTDVGGVRGEFSFPILMEAHAEGATVRQVIHSDDFGSPCTPERIILILLTSTGDGTNGSWDILPKGWGAGIPVAKIDTDDIRKVCSHIPRINMAPFCITEPTDLKEWLQENVLRPNHLFFIETPDGKISVRRLWSKNEATTIVARQWTIWSADHDVLFEIPELTMGQPPIGELEIKMNWNPGEDKYYGKIIAILGDGRERYKGQARNHEIEVKTVYDARVTLGGKAWRSINQGDVPDLLEGYLKVVWENFALNPPPEIDIEVPYNRLIDFTVGQVIQATCIVTPDLKGSDRGIVNEYFQIVEAKPAPERTSVKCHCWMIGIHDDDTRQLAPSGKVKSYVNPGPLGDPRINLEDSEFADTYGGYVYDVDAFTVGDEIMILDPQYRPKAGGVPEEVTIKAKGNGVGTCWVDLTGVPANPPAVGDYIDTARYDSCTASQKATWAFLADANAQLGAANDDAHKRER